MFQYTKNYPTNSLDEPFLELQFESDKNMMIDLQETFVFLKVTLSKGNVALQAVMTRCLSTIQCTLFSQIVRFILITIKFLFPMGPMLTKSSSLMNFLLRKEPRTLFAHVKVIGTRKNRHRLETNPSFLVKQRRRRKLAFMGSYPLMFSLARNSYSPTSKSAYA